MNSSHPFTSTDNLPQNNTSAKSASGSKRLQTELMSLMASGVTGISAFPNNENLFSWIGTINGPDGTPYETLKYKLSLDFPNGYPYQAPTVRFLTPIFHPNVDQRGNICLDILQDKWSALYDVRTILLSLQSLLGDPNNASPLNAVAANLWSDSVNYRKTVHEQYSERVEKGTLFAKNAQS